MQESSTVVTNETSITPESKQTKGTQYLLLGLIFAGIFYAYFIQPAEGQGTSKNPKSVMRWMVGHWEEVSNYSHGPLIPLISAGLIFRRSRRFLHLWNTNKNFQTLCYVVGAIVGIGLAWDSLPKPFMHFVMGLLDRVGIQKYDYISYTLFIPLFASLGFYLSEQIPAKSSKWGLFLTLFGVFVYWIGIKSAQTHTVVMSFIILLYGVPLYVFGREASRWLVFPISFLFLMVPLNFLDRITVPLANFVTMCAAGICNTIGVEVVYRGTAIMSAKGAFQFEIAEACSGIRSLVALGMVTAVYAYLTENVQWKRWAIFFASLPLAVLGNIARVTTIMLVAQAFGQNVAGGLYHDYSSFIFFPVALLGMLVFAAMLNLNYPLIWKRLTSSSSNHSPPPSATTESPV
jgi:exosortase